MKSILLTIIFLYPVLFAYNQDSNTFVLKNRSWGIITTHYGWQSTDYYTMYYKIGGDTIIESKNYYKISETCNCIFNPLAEYHETGLYMREDSANKVYLVSDYAEERLIYDFNIQKGDSVNTGIILGGHLWYALVDSVDSVLLYGVYRKRIVFDEGFDKEIWIEGIGSLTNTFFPFVNNVIADFRYDLLCQVDSIDIRYLDPRYDTCCVYYCIKNSLKEPPFVNADIKIFPIPTHDYLTINISDWSAEGYGKLVIMDINGNTIKINNIDNPVFNIDIRSFVSGVYLLHFYGKKEIKTFKIVIEK